MHSDLESPERRSRKPQLAARRFGEFTGDRQTKSMAFVRRIKAGTAQKIVDRLRETGEATQAGGSSFMNEQLSEDDSLMFLLGALLRRNNA